MRKILWLAAAFLISTPTSADEEIFFLNGIGAGNRYQIFRYLADGMPSPPKPVIGAEINGGAQHVAWASAFKLADGRTRVYASRFLNDKWIDLAYWESADSKTFEWGGIAVSADASEPFGIGPTKVYLDSASKRPFHLIYLVRNASGTGNSMRLATSADGVNWQREGVVLETTEPWESAGFTPSHVTKGADGTWVLFYHGYQTLMLGPAAIATAPTAKGPFTAKQIIVPPNAERLTITNARRLTNVATVQGTVRLGEPYVLRTGQNTEVITPVRRETEVITPVRREGDTVLFERPLAEDYPKGEMAHIAVAKIDPSYAWEVSDGWRGIFTGYGHYEGLTTEYTFFLKAPSVAGPWAIEPKGIAFRPWLSESLNSIENPTPVQDATRPNK